MKRRKDKVVPMQPRQESDSQSGMNQAVDGWGKMAGIGGNAALRRLATIHMWQRDPECDCGPGTDFCWEELAVC